jgi:hypothetical protein
MSNAQTSAIESNSITIKQGESLTTLSSPPPPSDVQLLVMTRLKLKHLLEECLLSLAGTPAAELQLDSETDIVVVTSLTDEWPKNPPVEERRMITALREDDVLTMPDSELKTSLKLSEMQMVEVRRVDDVEFAGLVAERVCLLCNLDVTGLMMESVSLKSNLEASGLADAGLRIESSPDGNGVEQAESRTLELVRTVRRSRRHWHTRVRASREPAPLVTVADGFNHPPEVG